MGVPVFGPSRAAARLESSKSFAREVMQPGRRARPGVRGFHRRSRRAGLPAPQPRPPRGQGRRAGRWQGGHRLRRRGAGGGLAVRACMSGRAFGDAGDTVLLEERLEGREVSVFAFCDGEHISRPW